MGKISFEKEEKFWKTLADISLGTHRFSDDDKIKRQINCMKIHYKPVYKKYFGRDFL